jgi:hypothetical protein
MQGWLAPHMQTLTPTWTTLLCSPAHEQTCPSPWTQAQTLQMLTSWQTQAAAVQATYEDAGPRHSLQERCMPTELLQVYTTMYAHNTLAYKGCLQSNPPVLIHCMSEEIYAVYAPELRQLPARQPLEYDAGVGPSTHSHTTLAY